ncbi:RNA polymerase sigma-70 factor (ECF subfamily) [Algoriphagus sp. 4150]|uniref:RNA polymerase sigma factor n=1 Tax=Algoriphagus sp. 4150 TaxID=2817756 RepID=UPI00285EEB34|nr:sigma-70 family RNA polymerase sigma factor [Algoriphagus sp. 4150]MDR7131794.1 RNA polymerase sigma-70 factor (ECF subfamily) [Algoriphagus sp. 4150]
MRESKKELFSRLYGQYYAMVFQLALGFVKGDRDQADDLSQEVFIQVWNHLDGFRYQSSHKTWIYRITVNCCLGFLKKSKRGAFLRDPSPGPLDQIGEEQENSHRILDELYRAMGQLDDLDRLIVTMMLEELPYEEISEVLGVSPSNLRVKIHRVKKKLKKLMNHE